MQKTADDIKHPAKGTQTVADELEDSDSDDSTTEDDVSDAQSDSELGEAGDAGWESGTVDGGKEGTGLYVYRLLMNLSDPDRRRRWYIWKRHRG